MPRIRKSWLCVLLAVVALASVPVRGAETDNPEYQMWSKYKPGTMVASKTVTTGAAETETLTSVTLKEVSTDKVVLEMKMSMNAGGQKMDLPVQNRDVPARMTVDTTMTKVKDAPKPEMKAGEETIKVAGKDVKCKWTESTIKAEKQTIVSKVWQCPDIPGGMARMESKTSGGDADMNMTMTVTEFAVK